MPIPTTRTNESAHVFLKHEKCNDCGLCAEVCKDFTIVMENGKVKISKTPLFGCIACGQCAAICPHDAISIAGRTLHSNDFVELPAKKMRASYASLYDLLLSRRSIRDFRDEEIPQNLVGKILDAAVTAPMGIPPSDVGVIVFKGKEKVRNFSFDFITELVKMKKIFSRPLLAVMRPFMSKADYEVSKSFLVPLISFFEKTKKQDRNFLLYDAPLAMYFYNSGYCDPCDPYIPATYAMIAAHSMGLGCCMIGSIAPFIKRMRKLKAKYGIPAGAKDGIFLIFGYPKYKYRKAIKRSFAKVTYVNGN
ncbi:MAG: nitroreductase family protein [Ignavibacteria bacterium]|nr:nitroreductase family protein [Ignavibacteria bacterium]